MRNLNTIRGQLTADEVSLICPHEHLFLDMTHEAVEPETDAERELFYGEITMDKLGILRRNPYVMRTNLILDSLKDALCELEYLRPHGCGLLVDVTSVGLGRDIEKLCEAGRRADIEIAVGCGLFVHDALPDGIESLSTEQISRLMIDEIENGIGDSRVKPGVIGEIGVSEKIYPIERKSLEAAAAASVVTGLPIYVHTYPWTRAGIEAVDVLLTKGVMPQKICVCHLDVTFDAEYLELALKRGVYVEFDNFGKEFYFESQQGAFSGGPFETDISRVRMLKYLIERGYTEQLLIANDLCLKASLHKYGGWGYDHVFTNIVPMMAMEKIDQSAIQIIVRENPKQFLFQD